MNSTVSKLDAKVAEMRRHFDDSFAMALPGQVAELEPMLAITLEGKQFALRVREISGVAEIRGKLVPVPSRVPELIGLTGVRGIVVPVFSLAKLLGFDSQHGKASWLVYCGETQAPIALAFDQMEYLFKVASSKTFARDEAFGYRSINATVNDGTMLRSVISTSLLVEYIKRRGQAKPASKT
jgi:purine-binding chemotaxis protein CheW